MSLISEGREKAIKPKTWQPGGGPPAAATKGQGSRNDRGAAGSGIAGVREEVILGEKVYAFRVLKNVFSVLDGGFEIQDFMFGDVFGGHGQGLGRC